VSNLEGLGPQLDHPPARRPGLVALDVSRRAIGVAGADPTWRLASPLTTIRRRRWAQDLDALRTVLRERGAGVVVIGWPLNMDGTEGPRCQAVRAFALRLDAELGPALGFNPTILLWDERLSTFAAEETADQAGLRGPKRAEMLDALAAAEILKDVLRALKRRHAGRDGPS